MFVTTVCGRCKASSILSGNAAAGGSASGAHHWPVDAAAGKIAEWKDTKTVGLTLRITPGKAVWYIRRRETTLRIGLATAIEVELARFVAEQTRLAAGRKRNLREYVETLVRLETTAEYKNPEGHLKWADMLADETSALAAKTHRRYRADVDLARPDPPLP